MHQLNRSKIFWKARSRLALWYAGVMGTILSLAGLSVYQVMAQYHWEAVDGEIEIVAGTLHDALLPNLQQPEQLSPNIKKILPNLCIPPEPCQQNLAASKLGVSQRSNYYLRLLNLSGQPIAIAGKQPKRIPWQSKAIAWDTLEDQDSNRYHQISLALQTEKGQPWGYLQVGRSLADYDIHLDESKLFLLIVLPIAFLLVSVASWYLAGMAIQPVYAAYQQIHQFTGDVAHELRTPLAAIRATVESHLHTDSEDIADTQEVLHTIHRQNHRLSQLVQDLLLLSRMDLNAMQWQQQDCSLKDLVSDLVEELAVLAMANQIDLKLKIDSSSPIYVRGDEAQLYRLVTNLITNAIQYSLPGGEVCITLATQEREAVIEVRDRGIGMEPTELTKIFDRFYRVSSDRSRVTGGSGLGLAIAQAIAKAQRGSITVESQLGKGSTFTLRLPLQ